MAQLMSLDDVPDALLPYAGRLSPRFYEVRKQVLAFILQVIVPSRKVYATQQKQLRAAAAARGEHPLRAPQPAVLAELREEAKRRGLYNFFLPEVSGLTVFEYAPIAELLGAFRLANAAMNCGAPDTGNMEVLEKFGSAEQKERWLKPLLAGEIRSCFAMTEPGVASSDASQISARIDRATDGSGDYIINAHKWWTSGALRPECKVAVLLGVTAQGGPRHRRQSVVLVPMDAPGVRVLHPLEVFGEEGDHAEVIFDNVRVPATALVLGEGRGFEIAQGRLGPGRIHHCMRTIGLAELALAALVHRATRRTAFGSLLSEKDTVRRAVAEARIEIAKCRQLCYLAAVMADEKGFKAARKYISMIKVAAPRMALKIVDEAIQVHGAHGVSQYCKLPALWRGLRTIRLADGPDIVHLNTVAKVELAEHAAGGAGAALGAAVSGRNPNIEKYGKFAHVAAAQSRSKL